MPTDTFIARCLEAARDGGALAKWEWHVGDPCCVPAWEGIHGGMEGVVAQVSEKQLRVCWFSRGLEWTDRNPTILPLPSLTRLVAELEAAGWYVRRTIDDSAQCWRRLLGWEYPNTVERKPAEPFADFTLRAYAAMKGDNHGKG
jgi:hypothetical protein